ncbi:carboxylesterase/lipase family protein [Pendulispora brunnea]|uniref:Carboxylic ester hydrolase n=1 Tax=Pendulispora brunnea TaxID=2905690 RepID=A0ABZ2JUM0_9BACT
MAIDTARKPNTAPVVDTEEGQVQGAFEHRVFVFKGIPYAQPPVGNLRWRPPLPITPWKGIFKADAYGKSSLQSREMCISSAGGDPGPQSEDCLYLNVWTPQPAPGASGAKLPVMVRIHGGAFLLGAGGLPPYNGASVAGRGAVIVTFNYRLGHLGNFAHPALDAEIPGGPANFALLDQIAALQWVQRNIAQFGGDPNNVTIVGQSAGSRSVLALFVSELAKGLFHKGIAQSFYGLQEHTRAEALERGVAFAKALGLAAGVKAADLRALPAETFWQLPATTAVAPVLVAGDSVLPMGIVEGFLAGKSHKLPLILGSTSDDTSVIDAFGFAPARLVQLLRDRNIDLNDLYPKITDERELGRRVYLDFVFTRLPRQLADVHSKVAPTWRYYFDYVMERARAEQPNGAPHGGDVPFVFDTGALVPEFAGILTEKDRKFAFAVSEYWLEFARTGNPAASVGPEWRPHENGPRGSKDYTLLLRDSIVCEENFRREILDAFIPASRAITLPPK